MFRESTNALLPLPIKRRHRRAPRGAGPVCRRRSCRAAPRVPASAPPRPGNQPRPPGRCSCTGVSSAAVAAAGRFELDGAGPARGGRPDGERVGGGANLERLRRWTGVLARMSAWGPRRIRTRRV
jgi:hypothetical protein